MVEQVETVRRLFGIRWRRLAFSSSIANRATGECCKIVFVRPTMRLRKKEKKNKKLCKHKDEVVELVRNR
jgi:hypothetical protein